MQSPTDYIIETIRQHIGEIDSHSHEILRLELWFYPETKSIEGFKITPYGSTFTEDDIKLNPADSSDIEELVAKSSHSSHSPQEQDLEKEEEEKQKQEPQISIEQLLRTEILRNKFPSLTDKQKVAVLLNCLRFSNRQAAKYIGISEPTYREHLKTALKKLHTLSPHNA